MPEVSPNNVSQKPLPAKSGISSDIQFVFFLTSADPGLREGGRQLGPAQMWNSLSCSPLLSANLGSDSRHSFCFKLSSSRGRPFLLVGTTQAAADLSCSSNKALRPWLCTFVEVQDCRSQGLNSKPSRAACRRHSVRPRQTIPAAPPWQ